MLVLSLYLAIRQCRISNIGKKLWMPLCFAAFGILAVLSLFDVPKIAGTNVWLFIECLAMIITGMEESCIQLGLIPVNSSFGMIASPADKPFIISDESGTPVNAAETARELFRRKEESGGSKAAQHNQYITLISAIQSAESPKILVEVCIFCGLKSSRLCV